MTGPDPTRRSFYEVLYVSPHEDDVLVSCPGRMLSERAQSLRVLVVIVFSGAAGEARGGSEQTLRRLGFDVSRLGFPPAAERSDFYDSYTRTVFERDSEDSLVLDDLANRLSELARETKARHVYLPLGAGGHADHRICHEAGLRAFQQETGRNIFFYEERPQALLPGAIRIRLGELGARLPPAAADIGDDASLARVAFSHGRAPFLAAARLGLWERARATRRVAAAYRAARAWNPARALGLRVQPVVEAMDGADFEGVLGLLAGAEARIAELFGSRERLARDAGRYGRRLSSRAYAERYWLLLPPRDKGGLVTLPPPSAGLL